MSITPSNTPDSAPDIWATPYVSSAKAEDAIRDSLGVDAPLVVRLRECLIEEIDRSSEHWEELQMLRQTTFDDVTDEIERLHDANKGYVTETTAQMRKKNEIIVKLRQMLADVGYTYKQLDEITDAKGDVEYA